MKNLLSLLAITLISASVIAQSPEKISYQAVVRDSENQLVTNQNVGLQVRLLQGSSSGTAVYSETHTPQANGNGLISIEIGTGTSGDNFSTIDWANGPFYIKTDVDPSGGTNYTISGVNQILSVPYALYSQETSEHTHTDLKIPVGIIMPFAGTNAPQGYLLCDGSNVSRTTYPALFTEIGTNYGLGDGTSTFTLPDLRGRIPVGLDPEQSNFEKLGKTGGEAEHILSADELPSHNHHVDPPYANTAANGTHQHSYNDRYNTSEKSDDADDRWVGSDGTTNVSRWTGSAGSHTHGIDIPGFSSNNTGGDHAHNNLQPYIVINYVIKY